MAEPTVLRARAAHEPLGQSRARGKIRFGPFGAPVAVGLSHLVSLWLGAGAQPPMYRTWTSGER